MKKHIQCISIIIIALLLNPYPAMVLAGGTVLAPLGARDAELFPYHQSFQSVVQGTAVGILRIINDNPKSYTLLKKIFDIQGNEIPAVIRYPAEQDKPFSQSMAIISCDDQGGLSHAEICARAWGIPHIIVEDLKNLALYNGMWVYIDAREDGVVFRLASKEEIINWETYKPKPPQPLLAGVDLSTNKNIVLFHQAKNPQEVSHKFAALYTIVSSIDSEAFVEETGRKAILHIHEGTVVLGD